MTPVTTFAGRRVALFGLGGSGLVTAQALIAGGADVVAWDDAEPQRARARAAGVAVADLREMGWQGVAALILTPGAPLTHPAPHWSVPLARAAGAEVIGDVELFCRERRARAPWAPFIAITGTNGKSTTTALTAHLARTLGHEVAMGGNIGVPILQLPPPSATRVHVVECSTFQIDLAPTLDPSCGVLLNLAPDHIDRHGTMERYAAIKERLVASSGRAVIGVDDESCRAIAERLRADGVATKEISVAGRPVRDGFVGDWPKVCRVRDGVRAEVADLTGVASLRGAHNAQNVCAALAALDDLIGEDADVRSAIASFPGLAHRMEEVGRVGATLFINDSKATNADAAEKALAAFARNIRWIIGGKAKEGGVAPLASYFPRVARAYLIGAASEDFAATLEGRADYQRCGTMDVAVAQAFADARAASSRGEGEQVILLSPACASYDQYPNFEKRGDHFRSLAQAIIAQA
jgi:UDP-N-acetylmuramoylalanine--D-glutamate ligase